jgi:hypothetical protein
MREYVRYRSTQGFFAFVPFVFRLSRHCDIPDLKTKKNNPVKCAQSILCGRFSILLHPAIFPFFGSKDIQLINIAPKTVTCCTPEALLLTDAVVIYFCKGRKNINDEFIEGVSLL